MTNTAALQRDLTIANATDAARNPYASAHMNQAHGNAIATLIETAPPAFAMFPSDGSFTDARKYVETLARILDAAVYRVAQDARDNGANITAANFLTLFQDALHDSDLPDDLTEAGEQLIEDARERELERV